MGGSDVKMVLIWVWCVVLVMMTRNIKVAQGIGVTWGREVYNQLMPTAVTDMLLNNKIENVRLYNSEPYVVGAFANTSIELMITIPNSLIDRLGLSYANAQQFVKEKVTTNTNMGVKIKYLAVGNEPLSKLNQESFHKTIFSALKHIQKALDEADPERKVKAVVPMSFDVCDFSAKLPSKGVFRDDIKDTMLQIVQFLNDNNAPFVVNISPFRAFFEDPSMSLDFARMGSDATTFKDNNLAYNNYFDTSHDTVAWALSNVGFPNMKIVVGEIGWPSDGHFNATNGIAKEFITWVTKKVYENIGTPLRPGTMEVYLYNLFDENKKSFSEGRPFERHWGLFDYDGNPRYRPMFTYINKDDVLHGTSVLGVTYLATRWCVLKESMKEKSELLDKTFKTACKVADCTNLYYGSSCNGVLDYFGNLSFAMNMVYQTYSQIHPDICTNEGDWLNGLGETVVNDPSVGFCMFKTQIIGASNILSAPSTPILALALLFVGLFIN